MTAPSLEQQVRDLAEWGIRFKLAEDELIAKLREYADPAAYEKDPYHLLLSIAGTDQVDGDGRVLRLSDDVLSFDLECVEEPDVYTGLVRKFADLAGGDARIEDPESLVDFEGQKAHLAFTHEGKRHVMDVKFEHDWFDVSVLERIAAMVRKPGKAFVCARDAQTITMLYCSPDVLAKLNRAANNRFRVMADASPGTGEPAAKLAASGTEKRGYASSRQYPGKHYGYAVTLILLSAICAAAIFRLGQMNAFRLSVLSVFGACGVVWLVRMLIRNRRTTAESATDDIRPDEQRQGEC